LSWTYPRFQGFPYSFTQFVSRSPLVSLESLDISWRGVYHKYLRLLPGLQKLHIHAGPSIFVQGDVDLFTPGETLRKCGDFYPLQLPQTFRALHDRSLSLFTTNLSDIVQARLAASATNGRSRIRVFHVIGCSPHKTLIDPYAETERAGARVRACVDSLKWEWRMPFPLPQYVALELRAWKSILASVSKPSGISYSLLAKYHHCRPWTYGITTTTFPLRYSVV
jgi:hypothetical protein